MTEAFTPPIPGDDASVDVLYADQVVEHMSGIDAARLWVAEALRLLRPGGTLFVVVPDYLKNGNSSGTSTTRTTSLPPSDGCGSFYATADLK